MTYDEALALLSPAEIERLRELARQAPPLTEAQTTLIVGLMTMRDDIDHADAA